MSGKWNDQIRWLEDVLRARSQISMQSSSERCPQASISHISTRWTSMTFTNDVLNIEDLGFPASIKGVQERMLCAFAMFDCARTYDGYGVMMATFAWFPTTVRLSCEALCDLFLVCRVVWINVFRPTRGNSWWYCLRIYAVKAQVKVQKPLSHSPPYCHKSQICWLPSPYEMHSPRP